MYIRAKFHKMGFIRLIGHLDTMKLFHKSLNRAKIRLKYSEGFNPQPKLSIPNPLPLGTESTAEYIEFQIEDEIDLREWLDKINAQLPQGIDIVKIGKVETTRSISREIFFSTYRLYFPEDTPQESIKLAVKALLEIDKIIVQREKKDKKTKRKKLVEIDLRPLLVSLEDGIDNYGSYVDFMCHSADGATLRADLLLKAFSEKIGKDIDYTACRVIRTGQLNIDKEDLDLGDF